MRIDEENKQMRGPTLIPHDTRHRPMRTYLYFDQIGEQKLTRKKFSPSSIASLCFLRYCFDQGESD